MKPPQHALHARYWLELKEALDAWVKTGDMPPLSLEAQQYFEEIATFVVRTFVARHSRLFQSVPPPQEGRESWAILLEYLCRIRPVTQTRLLDAIFDSALQRAAEEFGGFQAGLAAVEKALGWILNGFYTRVVREAMRDYVRQHAPAPTGVYLDSLQRDVPGADGGERTLEETMVPQGTEPWDSGIEGREVKAIGEFTATTVFSNAKPSLCLGLALRVLRLRRSVIISVADARVLALAGVAKTVFATGANECLNLLTQTLDRHPAILELDAEAKILAARAATAAMMDEAERWLFGGNWIAEFCRLQQWQRSDGTPRDCRAYLEKAKHLAQLLEERLNTAEKILSENEMGPVFSLLERPACPC